MTRKPYRRRPRGVPNLPTCLLCGRIVEPCRGVHGDVMHADDHRELGDDGHVATIAYVGYATSGRRGST